MLSFFLLLASSGLVSYAKPIGGNTLQHSQGPNPAKRIISTPTSLAAASSTVLGPPTVQTPVKRIFLDTDTCTDAQQKAINQAWEDAELLALAAAGGRYVLACDSKVLPQLNDTLNNTIVLLHIQTADFPLVLYYPRCKRAC